MSNDFRDLLFLSAAVALICSAVAPMLFRVFWPIPAALAYALLVIVLDRFAERYYPLQVEESNGTR